MISFERLLPSDGWNRRIFAAFLLLWAVSCTGVPYPKYFWLQHVPTVVAVIALVLADQRYHIGRLSYTLIVAFLALHLLGARYLYSFVPYDDWTKRLLGFSITDRFDFTRNHYDRFVHFCFGLLLVIPVWSFSRRGMRLDSLWSTAFALAAILAASALYEIFEWLAAVVMAPDWADSYNGQQGDAWDAQRDMALAACGAVAGLGIAAIRWFRPVGRDKVESRFR
jgi:putative membrane protein